MPIGFQKYDNGGGTPFKKNVSFAPQNQQTGLRVPFPNGQTPPEPGTGTTGFQDTTVRYSNSRSPYVIQGDATGGQFPQGFDRYGFVTDDFPWAAPDGTDIPYSGGASSAYGNYYFNAMDRMMAERNARVQAGMLQGLFGGTPAQSQQPFPVVYAQPDMSTQRMQQFDTMMNQVAQAQMYPGWRERMPYIDPED